MVLTLLRKHRQDDKCLPFPSHASATSSRDAPCAMKNDCKHHFIPIKYLNTAYLASSLTTLITDDPGTERQMK